MKREIDLAREVVRWLTDAGHDVYQEVMCEGWVADIVVKCGVALWVIECKMTLGLTVIDQATRWSWDFADFVSVAVPEPRKKRRANIIMKLARDYRFGIITVNEFNQVRQDIKPQMTRRKGFHKGHLMAALRPEHKRYAEAGTSNGGYWTPFKQTVKESIRFVSKHPGCTLKELVDGIDHHYSTDATARSTLVQWIREDVIERIRLDTSTRPFRLYPVDYLDNVVNVGDNGGERGP